MVVLDGLPPHTRAVLSAAPGTPAVPLYAGYGDVDLTCGNCGQILAQGLREPAQLAHLVLQCSGCQTYNGMDV
jgi:hypothetical protein